MFRSFLTFSGALFLAAWPLLGAPAITQVAGQPTDRTVTLNVRADSALEAYYDYGTAPASYAGQTAATALVADPNAAGFFVGQAVLRGLSPGTRYYYRLLFRPAGSTGTFAAAPERTVVTMRPPGSTFTFCIQGDSHPERAGKQFDATFYARIPVLDGLAAAVRARRAVKQS